MVSRPDTSWRARSDARSSIVVPGKFATLSIVLPTKYSGGEVTLIHTGGKKVFDPSIYSDLEASWTAW